jgi:DNA-directed RNA polymerase subunit RPC12/RpoP
MFEMKTYHCPACGTEIRDSLTDGQEYRCPSCQKKYLVLADPHSEKIGLVPLEVSKAEEPLYLPRGSLRAITTMTLAVCCWVLIFLDRPVPGYLFSLLLTIIGYYFGFRRKEAMVRGRLYDAAAKVENPLFLPSGFIRFFLIAGFVVAGGVLLARGKLTDLTYLEFFLILAGLIGGYLFGRFMAHMENATAIYNLFLHLKGLILLGSVITLVILLLTLRYQDYAYLSLACACLISFYYGSRS